MSLKDLMALHASTVFLNPEHFADTFTHIRADGTTETFAGVLEEDRAIPSLSGSGGDTVQRVGTLTCPLSIEVSCEPGRNASRFTRGTEEWIAVGVRDDKLTDVAMPDQLQDVIVVRNEVQSLKGGFGGTRQ